MKRLHLFEFEDQTWFPAYLRNCLTDFLEFLFVNFNLYKPTVSLIKDVLLSTNNEQIIDLCSGGSGPIKQIQKYLQEKENLKTKIILTDKYPNIDKFKHLKKKSSAEINFIANSVDATNVPEELKGIRTLFTSFHHFTEETGKKILQDAYNKKVAIAIFEAIDRSLYSLFLTLPLPLFVLFFTPFIKPFKLSRLFWTYIIPVAPLVVLWDGIISVFRIYNPDELLLLVEDLNKNYSWKAGKIKTIMNSKIVYLIGKPK